MTQEFSDEYLRARALYDKYIDTGLRMSPPFKGFAMEHLWFAIDEPQMYSMLFIESGHYKDIDDWIESEGHKEQVLEAISQTFHFDHAKSLMLYKALWPVMQGMVFSCVCLNMELSIEEMSKILGQSVRATLLAIKAGDDERSSYVPVSGNGPQGNVEEYIDKGVHEIGQRNNELMLQTMISQNRLLSSLHASPRYVRDNEWNELDRLSRGGFGISRRDLTERISSISQADARLIILEKLGFGVGATALLLGISPTSVTKARQRLKAKLSIDSVDDFVKNL